VLSKWRVEEMAHTLLHLLRVLSISDLPCSRYTTGYGLGFTGPARYDFGSPECPIYTDFDVKGGQCGTC
jgi:hypothetical protein